MEDEANYVCKATSEIGLAITKAKLRVTSKYAIYLSFLFSFLSATYESNLFYPLSTAGGPIDWQPEEEEEEIVETVIHKTHKKKKPEIKKAKETKEKIKPERVKVDKTPIQIEHVVPTEETDEKLV